MTDADTTDTTDTTDAAASDASDTASDTADDAATDASEVSDGVERGELVTVDGDVDGDDSDDSDGAKSQAMGSITEPAKVMRIGSMVKQLLDEVRDMTLDEPSRERLAEIYERSVVELTAALSPDLQDELMMLALPFDEDEVPTDAELRIAKAQLVGWLEGLFHGIQASLVAQQMAARQQLDQMRQIGPGGQPMPGQPGQPGQHVVPPQSDRPGTYI